MKKYQQLAEQLREQIASGIWQPGDRLPRCVTRWRFLA
ncbi:GntR family transcriptional regulator [Escherichia coli]|nr:GntR family transcriptional regulator [Escherichia coli]